MIDLNFNFDNEVDQKNDIPIFKGRVINKSSENNIMYEFIAQNHTQIFFNVKDIMNYIKKTSTKKDNYYIFTLVKNDHKVTLIMNDIKKIILFLLANHIKISY